MFSRPFTTPESTLFGSRLHLPGPETSHFILKVTFGKAHADAMRAEMRQFLRDAFGRIEGARAPVPLYAMSGDRWLLDYFSTAVPTICDRSGHPCLMSSLPPGSLVRIAGTYETMMSKRLAPIMSAVQVIKLAPAEVIERLFEPVS